MADELSEEKREQIRAEAERRGQDADAAIAYAESVFAQWRRAAGDEGDDHDDAGGLRGNPYAGLTQPDLIAKLAFNHRDCEVRDTATKMLRAALSYIESSHVGQSKDELPGMRGLQPSPRQRARIYLLSLIDYEQNTSPALPPLADRLLVDADVCGVARKDLAKATGISEKQLRTRISKAKAGIAEAEKRMGIPAGSLIRKPDRPI